MSLLFLLLHDSPPLTGFPFPPLEYNVYHVGGWHSVKFFSKLNEIFSGYFDPKNILYMININNFRGDLSNISAKKTSLVALLRAGAYVPDSTAVLRFDHNMEWVEMRAVNEAGGV